MTHYHYFIITAGPILDEQARLYFVGIGSSGQSNRDYLYLTAYAADHDCYFSPVTRDADAFVQRCEESIGYPLRMNSQRVSARSLVRYLKNGEGIKIPEYQLKNVDYLRKYLSINYRIISNLRNNPLA